MPPTLEREEALFCATPELQPGAARRAFLDRACAADASLRQRLESLPAAKAAIKLDLPDAGNEALGRRSGHDKLLEMVGDGGCGVVAARVGELFRQKFSGLEISRQ